MVNSKDRVRFRPARSTTFHFASGWAGMTGTHNQLSFFFFFPTEMGSLELSVQGDLTL